MELCRSLALLGGSLGLMFCLIALSTDFWFEAVGPTHSAHSGLWPTGHGDIISGHGPLVSTTAAFAAAISMVVAMAVYTSERWDQPPHPQIQTFFSWSFYLGWVSAILLLCTGALSLGAHCGGPRPGYETL
ncbi:protein NKG7 isoform X1 [Homo sapiens]|uniref:protein NKG7 isoform X1 n=1 Tax=Homo sapiens TaxID=9606 RepID=UPI000387C04F|nr:protein NKG7 isoform X1 [Homo sapiens]XP_054177053.1 protein NKG7 isoform X1 [Homo sapiens]|eukprot:XP_005259012.1 protein NKG7 isoform X2 [Homo sapiens]